MHIIHRGSVHRRMVPEVNYFVDTETARHAIIGSTFVKEL